MKRKSILDKQAVSKRNQINFSKFWRFLRTASLLSLKVSLLLTGMLFISVLFLYLYQYLVTSPYIKLEEVIINGVNEEIKHELIEMSELDTDLSLLAINLKKIKTDMEKHPWVKSITVEKRFPHTLIIKAEKEEPRAIVLLERLSYMNRQGRIFKEVERSENKNFPIITGISSAYDKRNKQIKTASLILDLFESETGSWSLEELSEIHVTEDCDVLLYSTSLPAVIKMGGSELETKKTELKKIARHLRETGRIHLVKTIDLNYRDGAVVSFNKSG